MSDTQKIHLYFNRNNFEYDVYHLVKAFFSDAEITMVKPEESCGGDAGEKEVSPKPDLLMTVTEEETFFSFIIQSKNAVSIRKEQAAQADADRKTRKNILKKIVYRALCEYTGHDLPWGSLTGIRPVRIPLDLAEQGWKNVDIAKHMRETYFTSPKKTALAIAIANREKDILESIDLKNGYSLYVGIPFCPTICLYHELDFISKLMSDKKLTSIYIGGGTPTSLEERTFSDLLIFINDHFPARDLLEFTVEAGRPDTITEEKLYAMLASGVSRISINPQTMNQKTLDLIGRRHTAEQTREAFAMARDLGFDNINMDLIAGLPGEGPKEVKETLRQIEELAPDSLTIHSLALKRSSRLNLFKEEYAPLSFNNSEEIMDSAGKTATALGMHPYYMYRQKNIAGNLENVGYAKDECFGIYNILIMEEKQTIVAAGSGAMTKWVLGEGRIERTPNVKDVGQYIERIEEMTERKYRAKTEWFG